MLTHPTLDKLRTLNCAGMAAALTEQMALPDIDALSFEERLGLLVDRELTERDNRRTANRLRRAPPQTPRPPSRTSITATRADWIKP